MAAFCRARDLSPATLRRWLNRHAAGGATALAARWGEKRGERRSLTPDDAEWIIGHYTDLDHPLITVETVFASYKQRCEDAHRPHASIGTVRALCDEPRVQHLKELAQVGQREFLAKRGACITRTRAESLPGDVYVSDHRQFDAACVWDDGKIVFPWLTAWEDYASTAIVGWVLSDKPNSETIKASLRRAILDFGVPTKVHTDNGKDYRARLFVGGRTILRQRAYHYEPDASAFDGLYVRLNCQTIYAVPYNARTKIIERFNAFLRSRFDPGCVGDRGSNVVERPAGVDDLLARTRQAVDEKRPVGLAHGTLPTRAEFAQLVGEFVQWYNNRAGEAEGLRGRTPNQVWQQAPRLRRVTADALSLLLMAHRDVTVCNGRVGFSIKGVRLEWYSDILHAHWAGKTVTVRFDPDDLAAVSVHEAGNDAFIASATLCVKVPGYSADHELTARAVAEVGRHNKRLLQMIDAGRQAERVYASDAAHVWQGRPDPRHLPPAVPDLPATPVEPVRTGLEKPARRAAAALRDAREAQRAVNDAVAEPATSALIDALFHQTPRPAPAADAPAARLQDFFQTTPTTED
jgi:transposase InsO family protein